MAAVEIGQVILDLTPEPRAVPPDDWTPEPPPSDVGLHQPRRRHPRPSARAPSSTSGVARLADVRRTAGRVGGVFAMARTMARQAPSSPLNVADRGAAAVRPGGHPARGLQEGPQGPRRHGQRRRARRRLGRPAQLAADPRRAGPREHGHPGDGPGQRASSRAAATTPAATRSPRCSSTCPSERAARSSACTA